MSVTEIPARFRHTCAGCGATEETATSSRPKYWCDLHIIRDAYDFQGCAVADGSVKLSLCLQCGEAAARAVNVALDERMAAATPGGACTCDFSHDGRKGRICEMCEAELRDEIERLRSSVARGEA